MTGGILVIAERLRLCTYTSKDGLLKMVKDAYGTGSLGRFYFTCTDKVGTLFLND